MITGFRKGGRSSRPPQSIFGVEVSGFGTGLFCANASWGGGRFMASKMADPSAKRRRGALRDIGAP